MTHAAIYTRKSTEQKVAKGAKAVERQEEFARQFAARQGWTVRNEHVFEDDGISGAEFARRPGLQKMLEAASRREFTHLIVSEQKSIGREIAETMYTVKQLALTGVDIYEYVHGQCITPKTTQAKLLSSVQGYADEDHREKTRERVHEAHHQRFKKGYVVGGRVFGYRNVWMFDGTDQHG